MGKVKPLIAFVVSVLIFRVTSAGESQWVYPGRSQRLLYSATEIGDRIPDFSAVGYEHGRIDPPTVSQAEFVAPGPGDDTRRIQDAIDRVSRRPSDANGFRGAVVLGAGEFQVETRIRIRASGVVLRGSGNDTASGTVLRATGTDDRALIHIARGGSLRRMGSDLRVADKYVPVGATSFRLESTDGLSIGDRVIVHRPSTAEWIAALGMDQIPPRADGGTVRQWTPGSRDLDSDRTIQRIEGNRVFLDAPLTNSLDVRFGGGSVYKYEYTSRIDHVGVENLWGISDYDETNPGDEAHSWTFIEIDGVEHGFVRNITARHFAKNAVSISRRGKNITVADAHFLDPISLIAGTRRYSFEVDGELNLVRDSRSDQSRHDFIFNSPSPGPNVFLDSFATNSLSDSGPHQRYSTGGLFDNVTVSGNNINVRNRGNFGTGHGWAGANMVIWNSKADGFIVQNPPTAQNWLIGSEGNVIDDTRFRAQQPGFIDHHGQNVDTPSLYKQQLADAISISGARHREYLLGDYDLYEYDGPDSIDQVQIPLPEYENPAPWNAALVGIANFDESSNDGDQVAPIDFQFQLAPDEQVFHGAVTIALTTMDSAGDQIWLAETDDLVRLTDLSISEGQSQVVLLEFIEGDLAAFDDGEFHMLIGDNTRVDWARLDIVVGGRVIGDSNLDGRFDTSDLVAVFKAGQYEDEIVGNSTWATGDWNRDMEFNSSDLVAAFRAGGFETSQDAVAVPEPTAIWLIAYTVLTVFIYRLGG